MDVSRFHIEIENLQISSTRCNRHERYSGPAKCLIDHQIVEQIRFTPADNNEDDDRNHCGDDWNYGEDDIKDDQNHDNSDSNHDEDDDSASEDDTDDCR